MIIFFLIFTCRIVERRNCVSCAKTKETTSNTPNSKYGRWFRQKKILWEMVRMQHRWAKIFETNCARVASVRSFASRWKRFFFPSPEFGERGGREPSRRGRRFDFSTPKATWRCAREPRERHVYVLSGGPGTDEQQTEPAWMLGSGLGRMGACC